MAKGTAEKVVVKTPRGRVSFPYLFEKSKNDKYEVTLIFPVDADLSELKKIAMQAIKERWGTKPKPFKSPFRKCKEKEIYAKEFDPESVFITFRSIKIKPHVVGRSREALEEADFYPGCWAWLTTNCYTYTKGGTPGLAFGVVNVQKTGDDDPLSGSFRNPEDDFEVLDDPDSEIDYKSEDDSFFEDDNENGEDDFL